MSVELAEILSMPIPERIKLVEDIWDSTAAESDAVKLSEEQRAELERRIENYKKNPSGTIPWETIKAEALTRK